MASSSLKSAAQTGFAQSTAYNTYRPTYSPTATQLLLEHIRVAGVSNAKIIDLAAGTGKFTEVLAQREENYAITAVEPHDEMRRVLAEKGLARVQTLGGSAEKIPFGDESVDAVVIAQAFHWFANISSLKEIHRVLAPHGALGMIWNIDDYNSPQTFQPRSTWEKKLHSLIWSFDDNEPRFRHEKWRAVFDEQLKSTPLSLFKASDQYFALPLGERDEDYEVWLTKEDVWNRFATLSQIAILEGEKRERVQSNVMEALNARDVETNDKGQVKLHGKTYVVWTTNIPEDGREHLVDVERSTK